MNVSCVINWNADLLPFESRISVQPGIRFSGHQLYIADIGSVDALDACRSISECGFRLQFEGSFLFSIVGFPATREDWDCVSCVELRPRENSFFQIVDNEGVLGSKGVPPGCRSLDGAVRANLKGHARPHVAGCGDIIVMTRQMADELIVDRLAPGCRLFVNGKESDNWTIPLPRKRTHALSEASYHKPRLCASCGHRFIPLTGLRIAADNDPIVDVVSELNGCYHRGNAHPIIVSTVMIRSLSAMFSSESFGISPVVYPDSYIAQSAIAIINLLANLAG